MQCDYITESFPASMVAEEVKKLRKDIEQMRKGKPLAGDVVVERPEVVVAKRAQDLVDKGMVAEWDREYYRATILYEQALRDFPAEKACDDARARLKSLRGNPAMVELIEKQRIDRECYQMMQMAHAYIASGHPEHARGYFERIITVHPKTEWARAAREELDKLK